MDAVSQSISYLESEATQKAFSLDGYWPKWDGPWWHMLLLHEMELTHMIPKTAVTAFVGALHRIPLKIFPIYPSDMPPGTDPFRGSPCHCQIGTVYQVLAKYGVNVDSELPWMRAWMLNYQMADGGYTCDNDAYLVKEEIPSSMVGLISIFEALLQYSPRGWTADERRVLDKGAQFLIDRKLTLGSATEYNKNERESAKTWADLAFPRFYYYDILRGLNALTLWAEKTQTPLPKSSIVDALSVMKNKFPDNNVKPGRKPFENKNTLYTDDDDKWAGRRPSKSHPLLEEVSEIGKTSSYLSKQWINVQQRVSNLKFI